MLRPIKKILIITKGGDETAASLGAEMTDFLSSHGVDVLTCEHLPGTCMLGEEAVGEYDLVVVLGGDGTFIGVARQVHFLKAPLVGVNLGQVGFLTQLHRGHWREWLTLVLAEGCNNTRRLMLQYEIFRDGDSIHKGLVVNDLVVSRGELARLIRLSLSYDNIPISTLRSDGLIVSTPTGSSAYGVSAGGHLSIIAYPYSVSPRFAPFSIVSSPWFFRQTASVGCGSKK